MRLVIASVVLILISLLFGIKTKAISTELDSSTLSVQIGSPSRLTYNFNYSSYTSQQVIEKISYKFPFQDISNLTVRSNGKDIKYEYVDDGNQKVLTLILSAAGKEFQIDPKIELSFTTNMVLKKYPKGEYFYLPPFVSDYTFQKMDFDIDFSYIKYSPKEVFTNNYAVQDTKIIGSTDGGILAFWEEMQSFNIIFPNLTSQVQDPLLLNLPVEDDYEIYYIQNPIFEFGLVDQMGNRYGLVNDGTDLTTSFFAKKRDSVINPNLNFNEFQSIQLDSEIESMSQLSQIDLLKSLNLYVIDKLSPLLVEETDLNLLKDLNTRIEGNSKLTSFEYCYYLSSLASSKGIKSRIVYGYSFFNSTESLVSPHTWCEFYIDSNIVIADPWAEDVYKVHILNTNGSDRFKYGYWNSNVGENNLLGITNHNSDNIVVEVKSGSFDFDSTNYLFSAEFPQSVKSGELNTFTLKFKKEFLFEEIKSLNVNGININYSSDKFKLALAPNSENKLKLKFDPGVFIFITPLYYLSANLQTSTLNISASGNANILPNTSLTILLICIALATFVFISFGYKYRQLTIIKFQGMALRLKSKYTRRA